MADPRLPRTATRATAAAACMRCRLRSGFARATRPSTTNTTPTKAGISDVALPESEATVTITPRRMSAPPSPRVLSAMTPVCRLSDVSEPSSPGLDCSPSPPHATATSGGDGVGPEVGEVHVLERRHVSGLQHHLAGVAGVEGLLPPHRTDTPLVAGTEAGEAVLRHRGTQVVAL